MNNNAFHQLIKIEIEYFYDYSKLFNDYDYSKQYIDADNSISLVIQSNKTILL